MYNPAPNLYKAGKRCYWQIKNSSLAQLARGKPGLFRVGPWMLKVAPRPLAARQLMREANCSRVALKWPVYSRHAVPLRTVVPGVAAGRFVPHDADELSVVDQMLQVCMETLALAINASQIQSRKVICRHAARLDVDLSHDEKLSNRFREIVQSDFYQFSVPQTPMHGDFLPKNGLIRDGTVTFIDWEYASDSGSILYDWWFFRRALRRTEGASAQLTRLNAFIGDSLERLGLSLEQFDGFGHAVHAVVDLARRSTRGSSIAVLTGTLDAMEELAQ